MSSNDDRLFNAIYSMNGKPEHIESAIWFGVAMLVAILVTLAFPEWRGIIG